MGIRVLLVDGVKLGDDFAIMFGKRAHRALRTRGAAGGGCEHGFAQHQRGLKRIALDEIDAEVA